MPSNVTTTRRQNGWNPVLPPPRLRQLAANLGQALPNINLSAILRLRVMLRQRIFSQSTFTSARTSPVVGSAACTTPSFFDASSRHCCSARSRISSVGSIEWSTSEISPPSSPELPHDTTPIDSARIAATRAARADTGKTIFRVQFGTLSANRQSLGKQTLGLRR